MLTSYIASSMAYLRFAPRHPKLNRGRMLSHQHLAAFLMIPRRLQKIAHAR